MRFVKCGSKLFDPKAVTAVDIDCGYEGGDSIKIDVAMVFVPGATLTFRGAEADAVRAYFLSIHATDLLRRDEGEAPEQVADNHNESEC
jgi:hypothetical protein